MPDGGRHGARPHSRTSHPEPGANAAAGLRSNVSGVDRLRALRCGAPIVGGRAFPAPNSGPGPAGSPSPMVCRNGFISTVVGNGTPGPAGDGGPATAAAINQPRAVAVDAEGNLFVTDTYNNRIRRVDPDGRITTVAGNGVGGYSGDGGPAIDAAIFRPHGVAVDNRGHLLIADSPNHRIRMVDLSSGLIRTVAGTGEEGFSGDGVEDIRPARSAPLRHPHARRRPPGGRHRQSPDPPCRPGRHHHHGGGNRRGRLDR